MRLLVPTARLLWFEVRMMTGGTTGSRIIVCVTCFFLTACKQRCNQLKTANYEQARNGEGK